MHIKTRKFEEIIFCPACHGLKKTCSVCNGVGKIIKIVTIELRTIIEGEIVNIDDTKESNIKKSNTKEDSNE